METTPEDNEVLRQILATLQKISVQLMRLDDVHSELRRIATRPKHNSGIVGLELTGNLETAVDPKARDRTVQVELASDSGGERSSAESKSTGSPKIGPLGLRI
jgi:hypothetical protein